jgi:hypothetical protein
MSFIDSYVEKVGEQTDSPPIFIRASAYYLVSATLGEFYVNRAVPRGVQRPNLWIILSSLPGRMRRSTVQSLAYSTYKRVIGDETACDTILEDGSPEGVIDAIKENIDAYTLHSTELGGVFARCKHSPYAQSLFTVWSKLYYGEGGVQHFSQRSDKPSIRILPSGLYITMLAGLQEPDLYFDETMLRQGLLRRLMIIYVPKALNWMDPINQNREKFNLDEHIKTLFFKRKSLISKKSVNVILDPDATKMINEYAKETDAQLDILPDSVALYRQTYWEHILKIGVIHAIDSEDRTDEITVTRQHVEKAMDFIKEYSVNIEPEIQKFGVEGERIKSRETDFQRILRMIKSDDEGFITASNVIRKFNWSADETSRMLTSMVEGDMIDPHKVQFGRTKIHIAYTLHGDLPEWVEANEVKMGPAEEGVLRGEC